jgi:hypothetical protein
MAHKNGLQTSLDLTMEAMLSPAPAAAASSAPVVVSKESSTSEPAHVSPVEKVHKVAKSSWRQRGLCLNESIMLRLKLESLKTGKSLSEVADDYLNRYLPNNRIAS